MSRNVMAAEFSRRLSDALASKDWAWADRSLEQLKILLLEAVSTASPNEITTIAASLSNASELFELKNSLRLKEDAVGLAWKMKDAANTASLAKRLRPAAPKEEVGDASLRDKILQVLRTTNYAALSNSAIAEKIEKSPSVVQRVLAQLRADGLVRSHRRGRKVLNSLTELGRGQARSLLERITASRANVVKKTDAPVFMGRDGGLRADGLYQSSNGAFLIEVKAHQKDYSIDHDKGGVVKVSPERAAKLEKRALDLMGHQSRDQSVTGAAYAGS